MDVMKSMIDSFRHLDAEIKDVQRERLNLKRQIEPLEDADKGLKKREQELTEQISTIRSFPGFVDALVESLPPSTDE